jgi:transcriptional regulator with XRE-family HTH domain
MTKGAKVNGSIRLAGAELRRVRKEAGVSQERLADELNKSQGLVSMAERGLDANAVLAALDRLQGVN